MFSGLGSKIGGASSSGFVRGFLKQSYHNPYLLLTGVLGTIGTIPIMKTWLFPSDADIDKLMRHPETFHKYVSAHSYLEKANYDSIKPYVNEVLLKDHSITCYKRDCPICRGEGPEQLGPVTEEEKAKDQLTWELQNYLVAMSRPELANAETYEDVCAKRAAVYRGY